MPTTKPAIVIVPGAWHRPPHYTLLTNALTSAGYNVTISEIPSCGPPAPLPDISQDVAAVQKAIKFYTEGQDTNVVLVMHSMCGLIGSSACKDLRPRDQPNGKGVIALVYLTAFAIEEGVSILEASGGVDSPWLRLSEKMPTGRWMYPDNPPHDPKETFYNDCTPEMQEAALRDLEMNYSDNTRRVPSWYSPWREIESNYLLCLRDNAIPLPDQEIFASQEGMWKRVERMDAGHSPFLSRPVETAAFVRRCAGEEL